MNNELKNLRNIVVSELKARGISADVYDAEKNNGQKVIGIRLGEGNVSPVVYINNGDLERDLDDVVDRLVSIFENTRDPEFNIDIDTLKDYESVKGKIFYTLVNTERNKEMLKTVPYRELEDLSIMYRVLVSADEENTASYIIKNDLMNLWGVTEEDLYDLATENSPKILPKYIRTIDEVLEELMGGLPFNTPDMLVATTRNGVNGASVILYPGILDGAAELFEDDMIIIPSSVHETLLVPAGVFMEAKVIAEMIADVNRTSVLPEEVLGDVPYIYSRETGEIKIYA